MSIPMQSPFRGNSQKPRLLINKGIPEINSLIFLKISVAVISFRNLIF